MTWRDVAEGRPLARADILGDRAAGPEAAAGRDRRGAGNVARQHDALLRPRGPRLGGRREERLGIGVMGRRPEDLRLRTDLDDAPEIHHRHAVGDVTHDGEIVRDEQVGEPPLLLQVLHEIDDLRLDRNVERRYRLVRHDEAGTERDRARDADALPLSAGELMGIAAHDGGRQADAVQQLRDNLAAVRRRADQAVGVERFGDGLQDGAPRAERAARVLEHHLHAPARPTQRGAGRGGDIRALEHDATRGRLDQAHDQAAGRRLAATGLAHQRQGFGLGNLERQIVDRPHDRFSPDERAPAAPRRKELRQSFDAQESRHARAAGSAKQAACWVSLT